MKERYEVCDLCMNVLGFSRPSVIVLIDKSIVGLLRLLIAAKENAFLSRLSRSPVTEWRRRTCSRACVCARATCVHVCVCVTWLFDRGPLGEYQLPTLSGSWMKRRQKWTERKAEIRKNASQKEERCGY